MQMDKYYPYIMSIIQIVYGNQYYPCLIIILIFPSKIWAKKCALYMAEYDVRVCVCVRVCTYIYIFKRECMCAYLFTLLLPSSQKGSAKPCLLQKPRAGDVQQCSQESHVVPLKNTDAGLQPQSTELESFCVEMQDVE